MEFIKQNFFTIFVAMVLFMYIPIFYQVYMLRKTLKEYHALKERFKK